MKSAKEIKFFKLQRSTANQATVNIRHRKQPRQIKHKQSTNSYVNFFKLQRSTANQATVNIRHRKQRFCIAGFYAAAIEYSNLLGMGRFFFLKKLTYELVDCLCLIWRGCFSCANRPHGLISQNTVF